VIGRLGEPRAGAAFFRSDGPPAARRYDQPRAVSAPTHKTKRELAIEGIREAIFRGDIRPGARLTMNDLSRILQMSPTPIREAIGVLEADGLVLSEPHRGVRVAQLSIQEAMELALLRAPMEGLATRLAVPNLGEEEVARLSALQAEMEDAVASGDDGALTHANADWHRSIYSAGRTTFVFRHVMRLWIPYPWKTVWVARNREASMRQHAAIMEAVVARDAPRAGELMHEHILSQCRLVIEEMGARGEYAPESLTAVASLLGEAPLPSSAAW
jgi:DNA-binding GntR family transcriptional regulator